MGTLVSIRTASEPIWKPVLRPEHLVQDAGEDVLAGVLLHLVEAPLPVDGAGDGGTGLCGLRQGIHRVPDDAVRLVDVGDMKHRAVGEVSVPLSAG